MTNNWIKAKFITEEKNRFICTIKIDNQLVECYVPSSAKLTNYIDLENRWVWVSSNKGKKTRTKYKLQAVELNNKLIPLNLSEYNELLARHLLQNGKYAETSIIREASISDSYKADILISDSLKPILYEVKAILTESNTALYPLRISDRALKQLCFFKNNHNDYSIYYCFIIPDYLEEICLNYSETQFIKEFISCIDQGMKVKFYASNWKNDNFNLEELDFQFSQNELIYRKAK